VRPEGLERPSGSQQNKVKIQVLVLASFTDQRRSLQSDSSQSGVPFGSTRTNDFWPTGALRQTLSYVEAELPRRRERDVELHLASCAICREKSYATISKFILHEIFCGSSGENVLELVVLACMCYVPRFVDSQRNPAGGRAKCHERRHLCADLHSGLR